MTIKYLLLSFILISCGPREVKFPENPQAISPYQVTESEKALLQQTGIFNKQSTLNSSTIKVGSATHPFSEYSSNQALTFLASKAIGSSSQVRFRGEVPNSGPGKGKMVITLIEDI